jgi:lysophospholipase L1-like esterase
LDLNTAVVLEPSGALEGTSTALTDLALTDSPRRFERYVAIGDSSTEGLDDPDGKGRYRGWADRLAERVARAQGSLLYANLAIRGRTTRQVLDDQLQPALDLQPDLATVFTGTNDVVSRSYDPEAVAADFLKMQSSLRNAGATVLSITLPDLSSVMPVARLIRERVERLNDDLRRISTETGAILVDLAKFSVASDPRLWSEDRLHANSDGHARIAWGLAHALGLPDAGDGWMEPLPEAPPRTMTGRVAAEAKWVGGYLVPWLWRHLWGRSSGDGLDPKRPELTPVALDGVW